MIDPTILDRIRTGTGFIAALDQSGGSTPGALKGYGIGADAFSNDEEMYGLIHAMRTRIITAPSFTGDKVLGAILFERTMDGEVMVSRCHRLCSTAACCRSSRSTRGSRRRPTGSN